MTDQNRKPWQAKISRRRFVGTGAMIAGAAGLAGYLPDSLARVAEASAAPSTGKFDLSQIKHLVFMMQENRSFDHYFGTFPGVAGFSDPRAMKLPDGRSVFQQPDPDNPDGYLEPWHMSTITSGAAAVPSLSHNWQPQHASWNDGAMDGWLRAHIAADTPAHGPFTMGYYNQEDIPFHWALAQAFTLCDHYHCSVLGPTSPNRMVWTNGTVDPQGLAGGPFLETAGTLTPLTFETGVETLFNAGISFKVYPLETGGESGVWAWQAKPALQDKATVPPALYNGIWAADALYGDGTPGGIGNPADPTPAANPDFAFEEDCSNGVLPDVSFLGTTTLGQEHPPYLPAAGAQLLASKLDALASNEDLWNTTLFVINYDENDGFFDHVLPPTPDMEEFPEEFVTKPSALGTPGGGRPVGGGFRVPAFIISPWTTGGRIFSGVSDHTSCLRLIEEVAAAGGLSGTGPVRFPLISRWRRQAFGDLTGALAGPARPAPTSPEFDPATRAAELASQTTSSKLPFPPPPETVQVAPTQVKASN